MKMPNRTKLNRTTVGDVSLCKKMEEALKKGRVLFIRTGPLGDFIVTLPGLHTIRAAHRDCHLQLLSSTSYGEFTKSQGIVDAYTDIWDGVLFPRLLAGDKVGLARDYLWSFDIIISFLNDPTGYLAKICQGGPKLVISGGPALMRNHRTHATVSVLEQLSSKGYVPEYPDPLVKKLYPPPLSKPYIHVHAGSGASCHNYPINMWSRICNEILSEGFECVLSSAHRDRDRVNKINRATRDRCLVLDSAPLSVLASCIGNSHRYLGQDSGVSHLAADRKSVV